MQHPNLARTDRIHRCGNQIALSMEEIRGETFAKWLSQVRVRPKDDVFTHLLHLMRDYASALSAIHGHRVVHRDIKPQNLMVDENGRGRIIDYGLVGTFDADINPLGFRHYLVGTPGYFAPEVLSRQCYLPAGDIYSLGRVMLQALRVISGDTLPVPVDDELHSVDEILNPNFDGVANAVPALLHEACIEMLQPAPGDRPTAMQVAHHGLRLRSRSAGRTRNRCLVATRNSRRYAIGQEGFMVAQKDICICTDPRGSEKLD